ncbi:MAG: T9SS type A sorting domain-containing protein [Flavobacteriales bacterium]
MDLQFDGTVTVQRDGQALDLAWSGGLNFAQFSEVDLDLDGLKDLVYFDRSGDKLITLLNTGGTGTGRYRLSRDFDAVWPFSQLHDWALFRDYDCDGKEDIFTYSLAGFSVFRNTSTDVLSFEQLVYRAECDYVFTDGTFQRSNLFVSSDDLPGLTDVDADGDLDVLTFSQLGSFVEYYKNVSVETYGTCDSLAFVRRNACWGRFAESSSTNDVTLDVDCPFNVPAPEIGGEPGTGLDEALADRAKAHAGSTITALDLNGDGVKDLLLGDIAYTNLVALTNGGTVDNSLMVSVDDQFPSTDVPVDLPVFPAAYHLDVDGDADRDLLVCPSARGLAQNHKGVWYYRNNGSDVAPDFEFQQDDLFQNRMLDVGEGADPVFFDHNRDGLMDLILSNEGYFDPTGNYVGKLALLQNIGTANEPAFELITDDYMNLSTSGIGVSMYPAFADLDGDGDKDMYIGDLQGRLHFYRNVATGPVAQFTLVTPNVTYQNGTEIDLGRQVTPQFVDLDRDGRMDLVVGEQNGNLNFVRNVGTTTAPSWTLVTDSLGKVLTVTAFTLGHSVPFIFTNADGDYELLAGSENGSLWHYTGIDGNLSGTWTLADTNFMDLDEGYRSTLSMHDVTGDGELDMVVGNYRGGVSFWRSDLPSGVLTRRVEAGTLTIRPNPTTGAFEVALPGSAAITSGTLAIRNALGQEVQRVHVAGPVMSFDLADQPNGVYTVQFDGAGTRLAPARVVVYR